ncbi:uncharacterized protein [Salvelinus sp. IW2-2015]|uniref:uncharacterized protein isoform X2 n=1 Tax=Salvelinus sp. IW2-2015 TaxID=2691554 RepID=UPI000CDFD4DB|nr:low-density lipoprotein receptor-related protein 4 isoform X2 [Salvelinus alpinus]
MPSVCRSLVCFASACHFVPTYCRARGIRNNRIPMDGKPLDPVLLLKSHGAVLGLAVDWIHEHLYWTNAGTHSIDVARLGGSVQRLLIEGLAMPTGVAVEPLLGVPEYAVGGGGVVVEGCVQAFQDTRLPRFLPERVPGSTHTLPLRLVLSRTLC